MLEAMVALRWLARAVVSGVLSGCFAADSTEADDYMDEDLPAGNCMTGTGGCETEGDDASGGGAPAGTCQSTVECDAGQICVATFDGDIGEFECRSMCIDDMDDGRWCLDDEACCNVGSVCSERGYCVPGEGTTTADETGGDTTTTDTGDGSTGAASSTGTGG